MALTSARSWHLSSPASAERGLHIFSPQRRQAVCSIRCCHSAERAQARSSRAGSVLWGLSEQRTSGHGAATAVAPPTAVRGRARFRRRAAPAASRPAMTAYERRAPARVRGPKREPASLKRRLTNGCAWNAVSAFANPGRAVAHVRGSYVPRPYIQIHARQKDIAIRSLRGWG